MTATKSKAKVLLAKGRAGLVLDHPFFGSLALRLKLVEDAGCPTAWTDGERMGFNPKFVEGLSLDEIKGVLCHEIMHCAMQHMTRRGEREVRKWNMAGDYAINQVLVDAKLTLPKGGRLDPAMKGLSAEVIYSRIPDPPLKGGEGEAGSGQGGSDQDQGDGQDSDPGGCGEVRDAKDDSGGKVLSPADMNEVAQTWKVAVKQAATQAKGIGDLPVGLDRLIDDIVEPKVDWREALRRFVDTAARSDYRWTPPNRRYLQAGFILPSLRSEELGRVVVAVDTSGSIGRKDLNQFASELSAILSAFRVGCTVLYCDTKVSVQEFEVDEPVVLKSVGGGGTDFRPPFKWVDEQGENPACFIYFTDGKATKFPMPPSYPVLWVLCEKGTDHYIQGCGFGEVVHL